jgi:Ca2+-binding EF-hand superfamily protein
MELLDKDRDGHVSRAEAAGVPTLAKVFDQFDRNRDGRLDRAELEAAEKAQPR